MSVHVCSCLHRNGDMDEYMHGNEDMSVHVCVYTEIKT